MIDADDHERIAWHVRQAHARALRAWADDPRSQAWVPDESITVKTGDNLLHPDFVVIGVHVPAFLLNGNLDPDVHVRAFLLDAESNPHGLDPQRMPDPNARTTQRYARNPGQPRFGPGGDAL